jgi:hypothetical protein
MRERQASKKRKKPRVNFLEPVASFWRRFVLSKRGTKTKILEHGFFFLSQYEYSIAKIS